MKFKILFIFFTLLSYKVSTQEIFYQDVFKGGVTGDGIGTFVSESPRDFSLEIPANSSIKKSFLFITTLKTKYSNLDNTFYERVINFNNHDINLSKESIISNFQIYRTNTNKVEVGIIVIDVTNLVTTSQNVYTLIPPKNQSSTAENGVFCDYYLFLAYDNLSMDNVNTAIIINHQDAAQSLTYNINDLNAIDLTNDVAFTFHSTWFCDTIKDGSYVFVNNNLLGLTGGLETNKQPSCSGVWGSFYYQNSSLFGLGNDIADYNMNGVDVLANIQPYISNPNAFDIHFEYQTPNYAYRSNPILQLFFAYTSPCDTFTTTLTADTTICYGETLQLQATGGQSYEWRALTSKDTTSGNLVPGLSCSDCPNPIFSGESSMTYSVRIWNNDSCSVVHPISINVSHPQNIKCYTGETKCGASNGYIKAVTLPSNLEDWYIVSANNDTLDQFVGNTHPHLGAGDYSVYYIDTFGCKSEDTLVTIGTYNNTVADFTVAPPSGAAPLTVNIENNSQNATDFEWLLDGTSTGAIPSTFFDPSGVYEVGLLAWELDKSCADTTWKTVLVYDSLTTLIPNVFTPNGDGVNDFFGITVNFPVETHLVVLNRWGNPVYEWRGVLEKGQNNLWNGKNKNGDLVNDGTYFYRIEFLQLEGEEKVRKTSGFVQVFGE